MPTVPTIETLIGELGTAEAESKLAGDGARLAREKKSRAAVDVIYSGAGVTGAVADIDSLRGSLLEAGVLKGTASKIATVIQAHTTGVIDLATLDQDTVTLAGLYGWVKKLTSEPSEVAEASNEPQVIEKIVEVPKVYKSPEEMIDDLIRNFVLNQSDPFSASGKILVIATDRIGRAVEPFSHE